MERLLLLDAKDYDEDMDVWARVAVRGIVFIGDKLLLLDDNKGEVSLPGGGQDEIKNSVIRDNAGTDGGGGVCARICGAA